MGITKNIKMRYEKQVTQTHSEKGKANKYNEQRKDGQIQRKRKNVK